MPQDTSKVRFTSEAMVYHLPVVNEATPVPSPPKCPRKICTARSNQWSSGEGTSLNLHATEPHFPPISQLVVPAQPKPRKNKDFKATRHHARPGELVIPVAPKTASAPGLSNPISAPDVFNKPEDIAMDYVDVDPSPSQINPAVPEPDFQQGSSKKHSPEVLALQGPSGLAMYRCLLENARDIGQEWPHLQTDLCMDPIAENCFADTLAMWLSYQATPDPRKIDYKEALDDPLKRAMEDYQWMFAAACKRC
ncbi:hypothetical protein PAXRUDRAFT_20306 [Paxillus rubicundulus Ve08.2h10]|uniref:Uncharacterized protein n=1 Tax=Paxillus rubicundulus Ve08.2h10 TaxID=930991 RepID=A0A0D0DA17_9AGAM|nr:hypothetical protein PAXRUDRAFT_20306 [Paxillus rubicundulus Ve08.2h10]